MVVSCYKKRNRFLKLDNYNGIRVKQSRDLDKSSLVGTTAGNGVVG